LIREPFCLEATHLTWRSGGVQTSFSVDVSAHRRIMAQALGVVHVIVSGKSSKHRLPQHSNKSKPAIFVGASAVKQPVGLAFAGNAIVIAAIDAAKKTLFSSEIPSI
jgi:hypothetical protein